MRETAFESHGSHPDKGVHTVGQIGEAEAVLGKVAAAARQLLELRRLSCQLLAVTEGAPRLLLAPKRRQRLAEPMVGLGILLVVPHGGERCGEGLLSARQP
jgi:hypothetical protein